MTRSKRNGKPWMRRTTLKPRACSPLTSAVRRSVCLVQCLGSVFILRGRLPGSQGYVKQVAPSRYRAMLMCCVLAGRAKKLTTADHNLVAAPTGYDSVRGVPGGGLNELIFYDNNQIRPLYLVFYDST